MMELNCTQKSVRFVVLLLAFIVTYNANLSAQFSFTVTPTPSFCPQNGELAFVSNCTDPAATFNYLATHLQTGSNFTSTTSPLVGLPPGTYNVTGQKLLNGVLETFTVTGVVIANNWNPIEFRVEVIDELCGNDGKIIVTVTNSADLANTASYEIIQGPIVFPAQASNQFCNLVPGTYRVRVNHTLCPDAMPLDIIVGTGQASTVAPTHSIFDVTCDSLTLRPLFSSSRNYAFPMTAVHTVCPPGGAAPIVFTTTIATIFDPAKEIRLPNFPSTFDIKCTYTDRCGNEFSRTTTRTRGIRHQDVISGGCVRPFRFFIDGGSPPYTYQFCQSPGGFVPAFVSSTNTILTFGAAPAGDYIIKITDMCGTQEVAFTHRDQNSALVANQRPGCSDGNGSVSLFSFAGFKSVSFTSAPPSYPGTLPDDLVGCILSDPTKIYLDGLPEGNYTVELIDSCCNMITRDFFLTGLEQELDFDLNIRCQSFDFFMNHTSNNASSNLSYRLEYLNPTTNTWSITDFSLDNNQLNGSYFDEGCYRINRRYRAWVKGGSTSCNEIIHEFCVEYGITFESGNAFQCDDGTVDVYLQATGPHPIEYCISQIDGVPQNPNIANGTNPVFVGLTPGVYQFLVKDTCNNVISREFDIRDLPPPIITADLCGEDGSLCLEGLSLLDFRWWEAAAPNVILGTGDCIDFPNFDAATSTGTYFLELSYSGVNSCIFDTLSYYIPPSVTMPNAGTDGMLTICESSTTIDLFSYLGTPYDLNGTWSVVSGAVNITGASMVSTAGLAPGTYVFKHSVIGVCEGMDMSTVTLTILDFAVTCNNLTITLDDDGCATLDPADIVATNNCVDETVSTTLSQSKITCADLGMGALCSASKSIIATVALGSGDSATCTSTITVQDNIPPNAFCASISVEANQTFLPTDLDGGSSDNCSSDLNFTINRNSYGCGALNGAGAGCLTTYAQELVVTDACGNSSTCEAIIFVRDTTDPTANCQDISVKLDGNGNAVIVPTQVNNGSVDNCTNDLTFSLSRTMFSCADLTGTGMTCATIIPVTLTVTDECQNSSTCTANVTVSDCTAPTISCSSVTLQLSANGTASVDASQLVTVSDNCTTSPQIIINRTSFTCSDLGITCSRNIAIPVTVIDACQNEATCSATVILEDNIGPTARCQDITRMLSNSGTATITAADIDNGSTDNCTTNLTYSLSKTILSCSDLTALGTADCISAAVVIMTVTDDCGYTDSCTSNVTLSDTTPPVARCTDHFAGLSDDAITIVTPEELAGGSTDNCTSALMMTSSKTNFACSDLTGTGVGFRTVIPVTVTVEDDCGNTSSCISNVTLVFDLPCEMSCLSQINLSLRETDCAAEVNSNMVLPGIDTVCSNPIFHTVILTDEHGNVLPDSTVTIDLLGQNITYEILNNDPRCDNSCWGNVRIEYKHLPQIDCPANDTLTCAALDVLPLPDVSGGGACTSTAFEIYLADEVREKIECGDPRADEYTHVVTRTYIATDGLGNTASCSQTLLLERLDITGLEFPPNAMVMCSDLSQFILAESGVPLPWLTTGLTGSGTAGVPVICHPSMPTTTGLVCPSTGSGTGVPVIPQTGATIVTADGVEIIPGDVVGNCSAAVLYTDVMLPQIGCTKKALRTWEIREWYCGAEFPIGPYVQEIQIKDDMPPLIECPAAFTITTNDDCAGDVTLPAATVIDGCDNGTNVSIEHPWGRVEGNGGTATLEVGIHTLTYKVADDCYNETSCTTSVTITDNTEPVAICERNTVISLTQTGTATVYASTFDDGSWDECSIGEMLVRRMTTDCDGDDLNFGPYVSFCCADAGTDVMVVFRVHDAGGNYSDCMVSVEVQDKTPPEISCPKDLTVDCQTVYSVDNLGLTFGQAVITDNCAHAYVPSESVDEVVNQCGAGEIARDLQVLAADGTVMATCKQQITFIDQNPFAPADIVWPSDLILDDSGRCSVTDLLPINLAPPHNTPSFPTQNEHCSLLGYDYTDIVTGQGGCMKIVRTWKVIDWCTQVNNQFAVYTNPVPQVIEISSANIPKILLGASPITFTSNDLDCVNADIDVTATVSNVCSAGLVWSWIIRDQGGNAIYTGTGNTITQKLVASNYTIDWSATSACGHVGTATQGLVVTNTKAPIPICMNGMNVFLTAGSGTLESHMINVGSYSPCNNPIEISFSPDVNDDVMNLGNGASDFCTSQITVVDDPNAPCSPGGRPVSIAGEVYTEAYQSVEDVEVSMATNMPFIMTDQLNGVSTLDLIHIQRHILGLELLESPYQLIAADINSSKDINGIDLVELRKLILGIYTEFPNNTSWRFIDSGYKFVDESLVPEHR